MDVQLTPHRNQGMHQRLEKASSAGDVDELHRLLHEDNLLLHRPSSHPYPIDSPLHVAAALGHARFVKEILVRRLEYAVGFNAHGLTALHLACANGHLPVVRELLQSNVGAEICSLRDKDGFLPIHIVALTGNISVLEELLGACSEDVVQGLTCLGDSILHLVVKSNSFKAIHFLIERLENDHEFLNLRDAKGNTLLHLATARKQLQTMKLLLDKSWTDVNAINKKGFTVLDVLLESPSEHGDLVLGELIREAGGTITKTAHVVEIHQSSELATIGNDTTGRLWNSWKFLKRMFIRFFTSISSKDPNKFKETRNTVMVVATLIATVTFQGGLNPPGGFAQSDDKEMRSGQALIGNRLGAFLFCDMIALLSSLSVILMMICGCPQWKYMINASMMVTWIAIFFTGLAFFFAVPVIFPVSTYGAFVLFLTWYVIISAFACYTVIRFHIRIYRKILRCIINMKKRLGGNVSCFLLFATHPVVLLLVRVCLIVSCIVACGGVAIFVLFLDDEPSSLNY